MLNEKKLKAKMIEQGYNVSKLSKGIGIDNTTFYRKVSKNTFSLKEVDSITEILNLSKEDAIEIFFTNVGA